MTANKRYKIHKEHRRLRGSMCFPCPQALQKVRLHRHLYRHLQNAKKTIHITWMACGLVEVDIRAVGTAQLSYLRIEAS